MKIKKLEIHNLASIKDAVIDFEKVPLSDAELFLITGTTGSGKTTLLDAISLALYNTTPRIAKGHGGKSEANDDNLTGKDPRNIMRLNTGQAHSKLWFEGNDGKEYLAEWSVSRGKYGKLNVGLSNEVWSITNLTTGSCTTGQKDGEYKEVAALIVAAVGLDFNQFCRTTMLAQGEFTEFLKSDEGAKAEILEKISGTEVYRKIGIEIHNQYGKAKKALEEEQKNHANIVTLPDEERYDLEAEFTQTDADTAKLAAKAEELQKCITWMENVDTLKAKVEKAEGEFKEAEEVISSEEFNRRKSEVEQWKATVEVREALANARRHKTNADTAAGRLAGLEKDFRDVLAGEAYESERLVSTVRDLELAEKEIEAQDDNVAVYENEQTIIANIGSWKSEVGAIDKSRKDLKKAEGELPGAEASLNQAEARLAKATKEEEDSRKLLDEVEAELVGIDLPGLRAEKEFLTSVKTIKTTIEGLRSEIVQTTEAIASKESELEDLKAVELAQKSELTRLEEEHKRRKQTIDKFAKEMRSALSIGIGRDDNFCPVCGHMVTELKADAILDEEYKKIQEEFNNQERKAKEASAAVMTVENFIKVTQNTLDNAKKKHDKETSNLTGMLAGRDDAETLNGASTDEVAEMVTALEGKIDEGEKTQQKKGELVKAHRECLDKMGKADKAHTESETALKMLKAEIVSLGNKIRESESKMNVLAVQIDKLLADSLVWEALWSNETDKFISELKSKAGTYRKTVENARKLKETAGQIRPILDFITDVKEEIMRAMPQWNVSDVPAMQKNGLQNMWSTLKSKVNSELETVSRESKFHNDFKGKVEEFLNGHQEFSIEILDRLMSISSNAHMNEDAYVSGKLTDHKTKEAAYKAAVGDLKKHLEEKPGALSEEDTKDSLKEEKTTVESLRDERNTRKGELQAKIDADDEARKKKGNTTLLDQLQEEYDMWNSFHNLFGDSDGDKLSKAAQSYVLESLLANANRHLKNMAPRYRLLVNPGTLNLKLEDQYNDYQTRSTNSISGGESFLVSLALALALADFGQHLGVSMLFIDEGFGTLSGVALTSAINTLKSLHTDSGRQVGIISHREEIRESIPVQIRVNLAPGTSASTVETCC